VHQRLFLAEVNEKTPIAAWIDRALTNRENDAVLAEIRKEVSATNQRFPLP
jgi:glycine/serine hydroxymethyltransferase